MPDIVRSILVILAGYVAVTLLTGITFTALGAMGPEAFTSPTGLSLLVVDGFISAALAGALTARLAARRRLRHAIGLGGLMMILGVANLAFNQGGEPLPFQIALIAIPLPAAALGGRIVANRMPGG